MTNLTTAETIRETKFAITNTIQDGFDRGSFVGHMVDEKWDNAKIRADATNRAHFEDLKAFTQAELAKYRSTLDKVLDKRATLALFRLVSSIPFGGSSKPEVTNWTMSGSYERPHTLADFIACMETIRDEIKDGFARDGTELDAFRNLKRDVAAMRRVLGVGETEGGSN